MYRGFVDRHTLFTPRQINFFVRAFRNLEFRVRPLGLQILFLDRNILAIPARLYQPRNLHISQPRHPGGAIAKLSIGSWIWSRCSVIDNGKQ